MASSCDFRSEAQGLIGAVKSAQQLIEETGGAVFSRSLGGLASVKGMWVKVVGRPGVPPGRQL
jgi:hypothetical protein